MRALMQVGSTAMHSNLMNNKKLTVIELET